MGFCKVSTWEPCSIVGGDVGQTWEQVSLKAVTTWQPWGAKETLHSPKVFCRAGGSLGRWPRSGLDYFSSYSSQARRD